MFLSTPPVARKKAREAAVGPLRRRAVSVDTVMYVTPRSAVIIFEAVGGVIHIVATQ
jgi:hypothetical protein